MDNSYYILAKKQIEIERLHICTWEFSNSPSYIEYGMEFSYDSFHADSLDLYLAVPSIDKKDEVLCLLENLSKEANSRFIFNDVVNGSDNVGKDEKDGIILKFESRKTLTILPCKPTIIESGLIKFEIEKPSKCEGNLYFRVLVKLAKNTIAIRKRGIAQTSYTYDFKINEKRNLPVNIKEFLKKESLKICKVGNLFCLHAVPDNFLFNYIDFSKLKNIRKLETKAFRDYLPYIKSIDKDCYNIMFLKDSNKESYSFFSICTEEMIGAKQIALGIGANVLCSLLFAFSSLRFIKDSTIEWYRQIPWEYWGALAILILLCIYLFTPLKKKF